MYCLRVGRPDHVSSRCRVLPLYDIRKEELGAKVAHPHHPIQNTEHWFSQTGFIRDRLPELSVSNGETKA